MAHGPIRTGQGALSGSDKNTIDPAAAGDLPGAEARQEADAAILAPNSTTPEESLTLSDDMIAAEARKGQVRWMWHTYLKSHWVLISIASLLMAIEGSMVGAVSYVMIPMFDRVFVQGDAGAIGWVGATIFGIFCIRAFSSVAHRVILARVAAFVTSSLQCDLLRHVMRLDITFHQANPPGALIDRVNGDADNLSHFASVVMTSLGRDFVALLSLTIVAVSIDLQWTLAALVGIPILVLPTVVAQKFVRRTTYSLRNIAGRMTNRLDEVFHGIAPVQLNALEDYQLSRFRVMAVERIWAQTKARFGTALIPGLVDIMTGIGFLTVLVYGGREIIDGTKTVGQFMAFFTAMALAFEPLRRLANLSGQWQQAAVSLARLRMLFDQKPNLTPPAAPRPIAEAQGDIVFEDVTLRYGKHPVLRGASFTARAGRTTALVGASGAGKSTVFNVLTRLAEADGGSVTLGGVPITALDPDALRGQFSMVTQDAMLFDETVADNILLGRTDVAPQALERALDAAQVTPFLPQLSAGLDTIAGPRGSALSGGQRQRVAIARALLRDTPILLLDEATSALDAESEGAVQAALEALSAGRTTLVIAHRLSTVRNADHIVVMDRGVVVESGTHAELMALGKAYARLHMLQFQTGAEG